MTGPLRWHRALAQSDIEVIAFVATGGGFDVEAQLSGVPFRMWLPHAGARARIYDAFTAHRYALVAGTSGDNPEDDVLLIAAAVRRLVA